MFNQVRKLLQPERKVPIIFFDKDKRAFVEVKQVIGDVCTCGGYTTFYGDSQTNIIRQVITKHYLRTHCYRVTAIDECKDAEMDTLVRAWRVKGWKA